MKILVCGSRNYPDRDRLEIILNQIDGVKDLVHGNAGARVMDPVTKLQAVDLNTGEELWIGADTLAKRWAEKKGGITIHEHPAEWKKLGPAAGPIRNKEMLEKHPDLRMVIAFPGGSGTADMVRRAKAAGIAVWEIK